ncbi:MAG: hypothetical protein A2143_02330 [Gallionellales bacterium RBG_16_57_15]|nr:MAG: hypothetical protein A2143_02330 [Gallionellales bacterium RBG_16_57_15]
MSKSLVERIRAARQTNVKVSGSITLVCRRPTDLEMLDIRSNPKTPGYMITQFIDGWQGVTELHLFSGGTADEVPFDHEIYDEWIADHPEFWDAIVEAVVDGYKAHKASLEESAKNSPPGSKV